MSDVPLTLATTIEDVLALAAELGEHDISPAALRTWTARLEARIAEYDGRPAQEGPVRGRPEMLARQRARVALLPLVEAFEARKRAAGAIDYADQVAYAARIAVASAEVGRRERARWRSCCSTSTRTPASASCGCWRRCSAATPATRCSPSATPGSRSTAGAGRRPARSSGSTAPSRGSGRRPSG